MWARSCDGQNRDVMMHPRCRGRQRLRYVCRPSLAGRPRALDRRARTDRGHRHGSTALYQRLLPWHDQFATTPITAAGRVELDPESRSELNARSGRVHGPPGTLPVVPVGDTRMSHRGSCLSSTIEVRHDGGPVHAGLLGEVVHGVAREEGGNHPVDFCGLESARLLPGFGRGRVGGESRPSAGFE